MKGKVKFGIICDLGVMFNNDWRIFGVRFTRIPPWQLLCYVNQNWNREHCVTYKNCVFCRNVKSYTTS